MYTIQFLSGPAKGRRLTVKTGTVRIGRGPDCSVRLSDPAMADRHAELEERGGALWLRNLDPLHGVEVNGERKAAADIPLQSRDKVKIGHTLLRIEISSQAAPARGGRLSSTQTFALVAALALIVGQAWLMLKFSRLHTPASAMESPVSPAVSNEVSGVAAGPAPAPAAEGTTTTNPPPETAKPAPAILPPAPPEPTVVEKTAPAETVTNLPPEKVDSPEPPAPEAPDSSSEPPPPADDGQAPDVNGGSEK